jgi:hypothetical protein
MKAQSYIYRFAACVLVLSCLALVVSVSYPAIKNMAVVVAADSNLPDLTMAEFTKLCKGTQKSWPDGRSFTLVLKDPTSPEMHVAVQKLFGVSPADAKTAIAKINEVRPLIKIVGSDEDVFRTVTATAGAVGLVDVYTINSAVKVLHIDVGYALK